MTAPNDLPQQRFQVKQLGSGPCLVVDRLHNDRLVASCPLEDDAHAIAALMRRDPVDALKFVVFTLERFDVIAPEAVSAKLGQTREGASAP
jgi:hypothetical protein